MKKDLQKQIAAKELSINKAVGAAELRYRVASNQVEQAEKARAANGKPMPLPIHEKAELVRMDGIANRHTDGSLLRYVYDQVKDELLANPNPEALSRVKGCSLMARLDAAKASERLEAARRFGEFRQLPLKDARGLDYTKSNREVSPQNALETVIRHFTDSAEQKKEQKDLTDAVRQQLARAEEHSIKARDFSGAVDKILGDHCRAAGVFPGQIAPMLNSQQIAELKDYAEKLPFLSAGRKEFSEAARLAEQHLQAREATQAVREPQQVRTHELSTRPIEQSASQPTSNTERSDRDNYSRGR